MDRDGQNIALGLKCTEWETVNLPESRCFKRHTVNVHNYLNERKVAFDPGEAGKYKIEALDERGAVVGVPIDAKGGTIGAGDYVCILGINLNQALAENVQLDEDLRQENETAEMYETSLGEAMGKLRSLSAQIKALGGRIGDALGGEAPAEGIEALKGALGLLIGITELEAEQKRLETARKLAQT